MMDTLPESRLYTFIDESREFALYFLEGQRLIQDLALLHGAGGQGFAYFRDVVLSIQPMIALLKHGEQLGFYIDSQEPLFRLKIEAAHQGTMRSTLLPEKLREFPQTVSGNVRVLKLFPNNRPPYESVLEADALPLGAIVNRVLLESYQVNCEVVLSRFSDQSLMLHQLPPLPRVEDYEYSQAAVRLRRRQIQESVEQIFGRALHDEGEIEAAFAATGFRLLTTRNVAFRCSCSRERMIRNLQLTCRGHVEMLFDPGETELEIICEYCKTRFTVSRAEVETRSEPLH